MTAAAAIAITRVESLAGLRALRSDWEALYARDPEAQFFLSWQFLAGAFASHPGRWLVLAARRGDGQLVGLLPLCVRVKWSESRRQLRNEIEFGGRLFWADYGGVLADPAHAEPAIAALAEAVQRLNWSRLALKGFRASALRFGLFVGAFVEERFALEALAERINDGATDNLLCPAIALPDSFEAYLAQRLRRNTREKLRQALRRLAAGELSVTITDAATRARDLAILERQWTEMWQARKGAATPRRAATYAAIIGRGLDDGTVRMSVLWRDGAPLGAIANFIDPVKRHVLHFVACRDRSCEDVRIGYILHGTNIRWAIENGFERYDFLRGDEPYKHALGAGDTRIRYPLIRTLTGTNLGGRLESAAIEDAVEIANRLHDAGDVAAALVASRQICDAAPDAAAAVRLRARLEAAA